MTNSLVGQTFCVDISDSLITNFFNWKINSAKEGSGYKLENKHKINLISTRIEFLDTLTLLYIRKFIVKNKLAALFTLQDIKYMQTQYESFNKFQKWNDSMLPLKLVDTDTLTNGQVLFWEFSIPLFTVSKNICIVMTNVSCMMKYCHGNLIALYQNQKSGSWKMIKCISYATF
jgi:hypothetical protein